LLPLCSGFGFAGFCGAGKGILLTWWIRSACSLWLLLWGELWLCLQPFFTVVYGPCGLAEELNLRWWSADLRFLGLLWGCCVAGWGKAWEVGARVTGCCWLWGSWCFAVSGFGVGTVCLFLLLIRWSRVDLCWCESRPPES
jgi:hypothetical protein